MISERMLDTFPITLMRNEKNGFCLPNAVKIAPCTLLFATPLPLVKRPRYHISCCSITTPLSSKRSPKLTNRHVSTRGSGILRMSSNSISVSSSCDELVSNAGNALPQGVFTIMLRMKFRPIMTVSDRKAVLLEYGRETCGEEGVLRCDILYQVTSRGVAKTNFFEIWTSFIDAQAYMEHEKTPHSSKLRLCLLNPSGGDNSVMLSKLAYAVSLMRPVFPDISVWRSPMDYSYDRSQKISLMAGGPSIAKRVTEEPMDKRRSLEALVSNVGLENVVILIATATAQSNEGMRYLRRTCEEYLKNLEISAGIVRTGILIEKQNPFTIVVMSVHDGADQDGACFDMDLADEYITNDGWIVRRYLSVFPDKLGWEKEAGEEILKFESNDTGMTSLLPGKLTAGQLATREPMQPQDVKMRLVQGVGCFDNIKDYIRQMTNLDTEVVRAMFVYGWNASRLHPLVVQLENNKLKDPGEIIFKFGLSVMSTELSANKLKEGLDFARAFQADIIIGYGGGTVMDTAKAIGRMGRTSQNEAEKYLEAIDSAAENQLGRLSLAVDSLPIPVLLIPTTIGSGAELTEQIICAGRKNNGKWHRVPLYIEDVPNTVRHASEKTVLVDSRVVSPRRLDGFHTSQGALQVVCLGIDALITSHDYPEEQTAHYALEGIAVTFKRVLAALREPENATGQPRDAILNAKTVIGLAIDGAGRMGVCLRLAIAVLDSLVDGRVPTVFRTVMIRVTAAIIEELCSREDLSFGEKSFRKLAKAMNVEGPSYVAGELLRRAEDCGVSLLGEVGMVSRCIPEVVSRVVRELQEEEGCSTLEKIFFNEETVERVLKSAMNQQYEL